CHAVAEKMNLFAQNRVTLGDDIVYHHYIPSNMLLALCILVFLYIVIFLLMLPGVPDMLGVFQHSGECALCAMRSSPVTLLPSFGFGPILHGMEGPLKVLFFSGFGMASRNIFANMVAPIVEYDIGKLLHLIIPYILGYMNNIMREQQGMVDSLKRNSKELTDSDDEDDDGAREGEDMGQPP
ncbi:hypothetical protein ACJX0J_006989, partial [Zea mays]